MRRVAICLVSLLVLGACSTLPTPTPLPATYPVKIRIHNASRMPLESVRLGEGSGAIDFPAIAPNSMSDTQGVEQVRLGDPVQVSIKGQSYQAALTAMESSEPLAPGVYSAMITLPRRMRATCQIR